MVRTRLINSSMQERDLQLFLDAINVKLPPIDPARADDYITIQLDPTLASLFQAKDNRAVLLAYSIQGEVFPVVLLFLRGNEEVQFCHSTLLLDSYTQGVDIANQLRKAVEELFSHSSDQLLATLEPSWANTPIDGLMDCRILWNPKPDIKIITDLFLEKLGEVVEIPLFPSVYHYNNPYEQNLLEVALPELEGCKDVLTLGTGAGLEAACISLKYGVYVDATDINPIAVANTLATSRRTGTDILVTAWVSDGMTNIKKSYDAILFEAPLATSEIKDIDPNRYDPGGTLLKGVLHTLPSYLKPGGRMYLMSCPDLTPYFPANGLEWKALRHFEAKSKLAIHQIWRK